MKVYYILLVTLVLTGCLNRKDIETSNILKNKTERIREIIKKVDFVELPCLIRYNPTNNSKYRLLNHAEDSLLSKDFIGGDVYIYGILPDTSNYYGIIYIAVAAAGTPHLITYSKEGTRIDVKAITEENSFIMAGEIISCEEYVEINKDLFLKYFFKSIVDYEYLENDSSKINRVCEQYEKKGEVLKSGKIEFQERIKIDCK